MYPIEKRIPNLLTFTNLFCGFVAVLACLSGDLVLAGWMIFIAAIADLLDGMAAKLLKAESALGAQLDSLADMVSFGLAPGLIAYMLLIKTHAAFLDWVYFYDIPLLAFIAFAIPAAGAYRLARYNLKNSSDHNFKGLPIPAGAMFFASLPLMLQYEVFVIKFNIYSLTQIILNPYIIIISILLVSWLMVSRISLISFKISNFRGPIAKMMVIFIALSALLFAFLLWADNYYFIHHIFLLNEKRSK